MLLTVADRYSFSFAVMGGDDFVFPHTKGINPRAQNAVVENFKGMAKEAGVAVKISREFKMRW